MIDQPRFKLTLWFTALMLAIYLVDGTFALWITDVGLTEAVDEDLFHAYQELLPDVDYVSGTATLRGWGKTFAQQQPIMGIGVQLFSPSGALLEEYGQVSSHVLTTGRIAANPTAYSHFYRLPKGGYIQIQMPARQHDQALQHFVISKFERVVLILIVVTICGWYFSGRVLERVVQSMQILRTFIDDAGHELKTPITVIENSLETLEAHLTEVQVDTSALDKIQRASTRLKGLATNMILLTRMEEPAVRLVFSDVQLSEVLRNIEWELGDAAAKKSVELVVGIKNDVMFRADKNAAAIMISNLVRNAIQFTPAGGRITVGGGKIDDKHLFISVDDTGEGIAAESMNLIFNRFYRADKARSTDAGGCGLGLAIVKAIATRHGGSVRVESIVGKGTSFRIVLPIHQTNNILSKDMTQYEDVKSNPRYGDHLMPTSVEKLG